MLEVEVLLAQWSAYQADQELPPGRRGGVPMPDVTVDSLLRLRRRLATRLAALDAGTLYRN